MGYTLDQLLEVTGIRDGSGSHVTKTASASGDLSKLAERCRRAVEATSDEVVESHHQDLVEKTAAIAVISRTLEEIKAIDGASPEAIKTAAQSTIPDQAIFIKAALDAGHSPYHIAEFLEKNAGIFDRVGRAIQTRRAVYGARKAGRMAMKAESRAGRAHREWMDVLRKAKGASQAEKAALVSRMRRELGDETTLKLLSAESSGYQGAVKDLKKNIPTPPTPKGPGGSSANAISTPLFNISKQQLQKAQKPALYAGAGYLGHRALTGNNNQSENKSGGPVIINR